jgi:hypothetical protein
VLFIKPCYRFKFRRVRRAVYVACMHLEDEAGNRSEKLEGTDHLGDVRISGRVILKQP